MAHLGQCLLLCFSAVALALRKKAEDTQDNLESVGRVAEFTKEVREDVVDGKGFSAPDVAAVNVSGTVVVGRDHHVGSSLALLQAQTESESVGPREEALFACTLAETSALTNCLTLIDIKCKAEGCKSLNRRKSYLWTHAREQPTMCSFLTCREWVRSCLNEDPAENAERCCTAAQNWTNDVATGPGMAWRDAAVVLGTFATSAVATTYGNIAAPIAGWIAPNVMAPVAAGAVNGAVRSLAYGAVARSAARNDAAQAIGEATAALIADTVLHGGASGMGTTASIIFGNAGGTLAGDVATVADDEAPGDEEMSLEVQLFVKKYLAAVSIFAAVKQKCHDGLCQTYESFPKQHMERLLQEC